MLSSTLSETAGDGSVLSPKNVAGKLDIPLIKLADLIGVNRNSLDNFKTSAKVQSALARLIQIITAATSVAGDERRALLWFKYEPIRGYSFKTPMQLVQEGRSDWVLIEIENIKNGVYA